MPKPIANLLAVALLATPMASFADSWGRHGISFSMTDTGTGQSCAERMKVSSEDDVRILQAEDSRDLPNQRLKITAARNGGIRVENWDKPTIGVKLCKVAIAKTDGEAQSVLQQVRMNVSSSEITVEGPTRYRGDSDDDNGPSWHAMFIVFTPKGATLDLTATNGGISLKRVDGNYTAHTQNGGISMDGSTGTLRAEAQNGGISLKDCNGDVKATVQNGGISIQLAENWNGKGLEASTHNGGLSLELPPNLKAGVEVSAGRWGSLICKADACNNGQRDWNDDSRTIRFGTGSPIIKLSTINGGTVIKERGAKGSSSRRSL